MPTRILGIDPGLSSSGWCFIDFNKKKLEKIDNPGETTLFDGEYKPELIDYGIIETDKNNRNSDRVFKHYVEIDKLVKFYDPDLVAIEDQYSSLNASTLKKLSHVRGVFMNLASQYNLDCYLYYPSSVKKIASGKGNASKEDMVKNINEYYGLDLSLGEKRGENMEDDIADAISVALSYIINKDKSTKI